MSTLPKENIFLIDDNLFALELSIAFRVGLFSSALVLDGSHGCRLLQLASVIYGQDLMRDTVRHELILALYVRPCNKRMGKYVNVMIHLLAIRLAK